MEAPAASTARRGIGRFFRSAVWAARAHYATLVAAAGVLLWVGRNQWFYNDEWDFMWPAQLVERLIEGHNGHWSVVSALVWMAFRELFGFSSYVPYLALAIVSHLALTHLMWRLLIRTATMPWVATLLAAVFALLGTVPENLLWGFQVGYMGAIALAVGALLISLRPSVGPGSITAIAALLVLSAMTAGTGLPFFIPVAVILLRAHGWRAAAAALLAPLAAYAVWFLAFAGPNSASIYRASGADDLLRGIPLFMGRMFVDGYTITTGVPSFGVIIVGAIAIYVIVAIGRRNVSNETLAIIAMIVAGLAFSMLTAYSRLHAGEGDGRAPRYTYVIIVATLPAIGVLLSYAVGASVRRLLAVAALVGFVFVYNVGALINGAHANADRARITQEAVSAALALADEFPTQIDPDARPLAVVHRSVSELAIVERDAGMTRTAFGEWAALTALVNVGLTVDDAHLTGGCDREIRPGDVLPIDGDGILVTVPGTSSATLTVVATARGERSDPRSLALAPGAHLIATVKPTHLEVQNPLEVGTTSDSPTTAVRLCATR